MYIAILFSIIILAMIVKNKKKYILLIGFILLLVACFRAETVGSDLTSYLSSYNVYRNLSFSSISRLRYEPLFALIYLFVHAIHGTFRLFLVICAVLTLIGPVFFIRKYSKLPWLSFFLYVSGLYYLSTLSMLRACIAMSLSLFAIDAVIEKKYKKAALFTIISCLTHYSSFVLILFFFFMFVKNYKIKFIVSAGIISVAMIGRSAIMTIVSLGYSSAYGMNLEMVSGSGYSLLLFFIVLWGFGKLFGKSEDELALLDVYDSLMLSSIVCQIIATSISLFTREARFFVIPAILIFPSVILSFIRLDYERNNVVACAYRLKNNSNNTIIIVIVCLMFVLMFVSYLSGDDSTGILPYKFVEFSEFVLW